MVSVYMCEWSEGWELSLHMDIPQIIGVAFRKVAENELFINNKNVFITTLEARMFKILISVGSGFW